MADRDDIINRINEVCYKNGLELITAEQFNAVLQYMLANIPVSEEMDYVSKVTDPVENRVLTSAADGTLKQSDVLISQITGLDLSRAKFTPEGGLAVKMLNLTPGSLYKGTICSASKKAESWQGYVKDFIPTGATTGNSDNYKFYLDVRNYYSGSTMFFQVNIYKDMAKTELVGHVPYSELSGADIGYDQTIIEDNSSGLTGVIKSGNYTTPTNALHEDYIFAPFNAVEKSTLATELKYAVCYEDIAYGYEGWIVVGGIAEVLLENSFGCNYGESAYLYASGRAKSSALPDTSVLANYASYFGRFLDKKAGGTNVLARVMLK